MRSIKQLPTEKVIYLWNLISNVSNAAVSVLFLIVITRLTDSFSSDAFSLGWAVAQMMFTIGTFQVRLFQATDASAKYSFQQYLIYRGITIFVMIASSIGYILWNRYTGTKAWVILLLCSYKAVDALSDVYQGWFQQKERLDLAGKALAIRVLTAFTLFFIVLYVTRNVVWSCVAINISSWICFVLFDLRYLKCSDLEGPRPRFQGGGWIVQLTIQCFPLFLNFFLITAIFNSPKLAIEKAIADFSLPEGSQTAYSIIFMPSSCINLVYLVFRHIVTKMAIAWQEKDIGKFKQHLRSILSALLALSVVICFMGWLCGIPVLQMVYSFNLEGLKPTLVILLLGGCCNALINAFDNAITVMRKQYTMLPIYMATAVGIAMIAPGLVNNAGLLGAAEAFLFSQVGLLALIVLLYCFFIRRQTPPIDVNLIDEVNKT